MKATLRRVAFGLALASVASGAHAAWERITDVGDGEAVFYIDRATLQRKGPVVKVWELQDLKNATPQGILSIKLLLEFDCGERRSRVVQGASYSANMAKGKPLETDKTPADWTYNAPGTAADLIDRAVCRR